MSFEQLDRSFRPRSVAVVGASDTPPSWGHAYMHGCTQYGYRGRVYPVNPRRKELFGLRCYPSLKDIPHSVDYVICCLPAAKSVEVIPECEGKGVKMVHLLAADFGEAETAEALRRARALGIRLLGPNCLGLYNPREGLSFTFDFPGEAGKVGLFLQSGGIPGQLVRYAAARGVRFSKVVSYGNGDDINEADLLEYFRDDPETEVIACYLEGARDGRRFFRALRETAGSKPVIVLKAGRSDAGIRAAASHTAALAGSQVAWESALKQTGAVQVQTLDEIIDMLVAFSFVPPLRGRNVGVLGGSGGRSVLSADEWGDAGFNITPVPQDIKAEVKRRFPGEDHSWVRTPIDVSAMPLPNLLDGAEMVVLQLMGEDSRVDLLVANIAVEAPFERETWTSLIKRQVGDVLRLKEEGKKPLVVVLSLPACGSEEMGDWRWQLLAAQKTRLLAARLPVFLSIRQAASSLGKLVRYWEKASYL